MGSSFLSRREPLVQQAGDMAGSAGGGLHQLPRTSRKIPQIPIKRMVKLCSRCEEIDFSAIFSETTASCSYRWGYTYNLHLGRLKSEASCVLCRFFYTMRYNPSSTDQETEGYILQSYWLGGNMTPSVAYSVSLFATSMVLCVLSSNFMVYKLGKPTGTAPPPDRYWIVPHSFAAAPFFSHPKPGLSALPFFSTLINYPLIRAWCEHCDLHHSTCASATKTEPRSDQQGVGPVVRCIDCRTREIVEIQTSDRFFALSYVWGERPAPGSEYVIGTRGTASKSGLRQLPSGIPTVIQDAMIMVTSLGGRYLWVDQYCIDQDDVDDKHAQIGNMAAIYEGAYATIVAFSATDSACGLPGVRNLARKSYPSVAHPKQPLSALRPSAIRSAELITASVWMTRGWTYQEAILSRRLLIVTDHQVEFVCANAVWHECTLPRMGDKPLPSTPPGIIYPTGPVNLLEAITPIERRAGKIPVRMDVLKKCIEEYSGRHLTYQSDILNAITGLLSRISALTYLGIPILDRVEMAASVPRTFGLEMALCRFLTGLAWYPAHEGKVPLKRRYAFPSWSWLGWEGRITLPDPTETFDDEASTRPQPTQPSARASVWVTNQVTHTKGETLVPLTHLLEEPPLGKEPTGIIPHLNNYLWLEGQMIKMKFRIKHENSGKGLFISNICHPQIGGHPLTTIRFRNCSPDRPSQGTVYQRIITEQWDCLLVVTEEFPRYRTGSFLILDQIQPDEDMEVEECYNVIGTAKLDFRNCIGYDHSYFDPWDYPSLRRRIKLC